METLPITWALALRVWWSFTWRGLLLGILAGAGVGAFAGIILGAMGMVGQIAVFAQYLGMIVGIIAGVWVVKMVLSKPFKGYRIALIPSDDTYIIHSSPFKGTNDSVERQISRLH